MTTASDRCHSPSRHMSPSRQTKRVQGLPVLHKAYPNHWVFDQHPLFNDVSGEFDVYDRWQAWERLAVLVHDDVLAHKATSKQLNHVFAMPAYRPTSTLQELAAQCGATFASDRISTLEALDPVQALARERKQVWHICSSSLAQCV